MATQQRQRLIQLVHVAKGQLELNEVTYRDVLKSLTGKASCSKMNVAELDKVLEHFKNSGFKVKSTKKPRKRLSLKTTQNTLGEVAKLRAIWITMFKQGFVRDGSEQELDAYINRMLNKTKIDKQGESSKPSNVSFHAQFLNVYQAVKVLEILKSWHKREMIKALKTKDYTCSTEASYARMSEWYENIVLGVKNEGEEHA